MRTGESLPKLQRNGVFVYFASGVFVFCFDRFGYQGASHGATTFGQRISPHHQGRSKRKFRLFKKMKNLFYVLIDESADLFKKLT